MNSKLFLAIPLMLFLLVPTAVFAQTDFGATSSATTSGFESFTETESTSLTSVESPPDDTFIGDTPVTAFSQTPETVTGLTSSPPDGFEIVTVEKFGTNYETFVDESGYLYRVYDMWSNVTITGLVNSEQRTFQQYNDSWHYELDADNKIIIINDMVEQSEYPQVTENYTIEEIGEDTFTYSTHTPYISNGYDWIPYILGEDDQVVQVQVNGGKFVFDKLQGAVTIFDDQGIIIDSDSYTVRTALLNSDVWNNLSVNDGIVTTTVVESGESVTVSFIRENTEGLFKTEYVIGEGEVKTTAYFTNYTFENNKFAFTQTLNLPDSIITLNDDIIDLNDYVGQTFPREILEQNEDLVLNIKDMYYNSGLGFENLWSVNVTSPTKVSLDYANVSQTQTAIGETVELDPTFTTSAGDHYFIRSTDTSGTACSTTVAWSNSQTVSTISKYRSDQVQPCDASITSFDTTSIPDTSTVSSINLTYDTVATIYYASETCKFTSIQNNPLTSSSQTRLNDVLGGSAYYTNDTSCLSANIGTGNVINLGSSANTDLQNQLTNDWFGVGHIFDDWVRTSGSGGNKSIQLHNLQLQVTYTSPPSTPTNVTATFNSPNVDLSWTASDSYSGYVVSSDAASSSNGVNYGATTGVSGVIGNAWDFDGVNDYVTGINNYDFSTGYTYSFWINHALKNYSIPLQSNYGNISNNPYMVTYSNANWYVNAQQANGVLTANVWQHLAVTCTGTTLTMYLDGVSVGGNTHPSLCTDGTVGSTHMFLGAGNNQSSPVDGSIDELSFWGRGLTSSEVTTLYNSGNGNPPSALSNLSELQGYYDFEQTGNSLTNMAVTTDPTLSYNVIRDGVTIGTPTSTTFTDSPSMGSVYNYMLSATTTYGTSGNSTTQSIDLSLPDAPTGLTATFNAPNVDLSWSASGAGGSPITGYKIETSTNGTTWSDVTATTGNTNTTYSHTNPTLGSLNYYKVSSITAYGESTTATLDATGNQIGLRSDQTSGTTCPTTTTGSGSGNGVALLASWGSGNAWGCDSQMTEFDTSAIPDGATITNIDFKYDTISYSGYTSTTTCDMVSVSSQPSISNGQTMMNDLYGNTDYVSAVQACVAGSHGTGLISNLGNQANTDLQNQLSSDWFAVGTKMSTRNTSHNAIHFDNRELQVTYTNPPVSVLAGTPPDPPTITGTSIASPNVTPLDITVDWSSPLNTGSAGISNFEVYRDGVLVTTVGNVNTYTDTVPTSGTFVYSLKTVTSHGISILSGTASQTTATPPPAPISAPTLDIANPNPSPFDVTVTYAMPSSGGSAITSFEIFRSTDDVTFASVGTTSTLIFSDTVPSAGLYYYKFASTNLVGVGTQSPSGNITTATVPVAIVDLAASAITDTSATLTWSVPSNGGSNIVEYKIIRDGSQIATSVVPSYTDSTVLTQTSYVYGVITNNNVGDSATSNAITVLTDGVPDAPVVTVSQNSINSLDLSWTIPADYNSAITGYKIERNDGSGYVIELANTGTVGTTYNVIGLTPISEYTFRISAINAYGTGPGGVNSNWTNPTAPTGLSVIPDSTSTNLDLYWDSNVSATGYKIERETGIGNGWSVVTADTGNTNTTYQDTGLVSNVFYNYRISTVTPVGNSVSSSTYAQTTFHLPDPVVSLTADDGLAGTVALSWTAPAAPYGSILGYTIYQVTAPGTAATATATLSTTLDQISSVTITNPGALYLSAPTVTISAPSGVAPFTTATATAVITGGVVTGITVTNVGDGYNTPPTVTISVPAGNTIVGSGTVLTPVISDTLSTLTTYSLPVADPSATYSFAVSPITVHGSTILGAGIVSISPDQVFEGITINISDEVNPIQTAIIFNKTIVGNDTNLMMTYGSSLNLTCETSNPFTTGKTTYANLAETPLGNGKVTHTMTFQNYNNSIVDVFCFDQNDPTINGKARIAQNTIPLKTQMDDFNSNIFGTGTSFAGIDLMTLVVVIVGMIGFNRKNPAVGLALMAGILGILSLLQIIQWETTAIGGIVLVVFLGITMGLKNR